MSDRYCVDCFQNPEVKSWIGRHAEPGYCEFCRKFSDLTVAAEPFLDELLNCIYSQFSTPDEDGMRFVSPSDKPRKTISEIREMRSVVVA